MIAPLPSQTTGTISIGMDYLYTKRKYVIIRQ